MQEWFTGKRVLITGGLGFIGSSIARRLVNVADITLVDSLIPEYGGHLANISGIEDKVQVNISDVRDPHSMRYLVQDVDVVFNMAGQTSHLDSMSDPYTDLDINARAQLSILEALRHFNPQAKIVFASTRQLYGRPEYLPVDEKHPVNPVDVNGINKSAGEWYHLLYHQVYGIPACVLRLTNTYGPGMRIKDARQTFVGIWIRRVLESAPFEVWGGEQLRDFNYIDDVVDAFLQAAQNDKADGRVFNLGSNEVVSLKTLADILITANNDDAEFIIREFPEERKKIDTEKKTGKPWTESNKELLEKMGRIGKFLACSGFPECRHTESLDKDKPKDLDVHCPKCVAGKVIEKKTRRGKFFYGCSKYPDCDFATWDKPYIEQITGTTKKRVAKCPKCEKVLVEKNTKLYGEQILCSNKECSKSKSRATKH